MMMSKTDVRHQLNQPVGEVTENLSPGVRVYQTGELFGAAKEIGIAHDGTLYRLRVTRAGKLILTK